MDFGGYIEPALAPLIAMLYFVGYAFKRSALVRDKHIPLLLAAVGIALAMLWALVQTPEDILAAVFTAAIQGTLCAAAAVYTNHVKKQCGKP